MSKKPSKLEEDTRTRTYSAGNITEYFKRKRETTEQEQLHINPFITSKKIARSPLKVMEKTTIGIESTPLSKENVEENNMNGKEAEAGMMQMMKQLLENNNKVMNAMEEMRKENADSKQKMENLIEQFNKREKQWDEEKEKLIAKIKKIEDKLESQEKREKRNDIVITGINIGLDKELESGVEEFLSMEIGVKAKVKAAFKIGIPGKQKIIAKMSSWEEKKTVMQNKSKLRDQEKGKGRVFIDNNLTENERTVQKKIIEVSKEERMKGRRTKIGYKKLLIEGKWFHWNEKNQKLEENFQ